MSRDTSSAELLRIIAETLGTDVETFGARRTGRVPDADCATAAERHGAVLLFRMIRAFDALPDDASRLFALRYVEALASRPDRVGN